MRSDANNVDNVDTVDNVGSVDNLKQYQTIGNKILKTLLYHLILNMVFRDASASKKIITALLSPFISIRIIIKAINIATTKRNLNPQRRSSSVTVPLTSVTFSLLDNPSQKSIVVH